MALSVAAEMTHHCRSREEELPSVDAPLMKIALVRIFALALCGKEELDHR
jgi:hypothetical protein